MFLGENRLGVDVAVPIQPTYSNEVRAGCLEVQVQKGSSDIMKIVVTETTERPGADVDDGFATTESELGEAAERGDACREWHRYGVCGWQRQRASGSIRTVQGQLQSLLVKLGITGSNSTMPEQNQNSRSLRVKAARTPPQQQQSRVQDSAGRTSEPKDG